MESIRGVKRETMGVPGTIKYEILKNIDERIITQIKWVYIFSSDGFDVIIITNKDEVYGCGSNRGGRLGLGHSDHVDQPIIIEELCGKNIIKIIAGSKFMLALTQQGMVYAWGNGSSGMLGNVDIKDEDVCYRAAKVCLTENMKIIDIICVYYFTYLLTQSGHVYWFGKRKYQDLEQLVPIKFAGIENQKIIGIFGGFNFILLLTKTNRVYSFGSNSYGELGLGHCNDMDKPAIVDLAGLTVKKIVSASSHNLILTTEGDIYTFGNNSSGQLGIGSTDNQNMPTLIHTNNKFIDIYAKYSLSMALSVKNYVYVWGSSRSAVILRPQRTEFSSFQDTINYYSISVFTYRPLKFEEIFENNNNSDQTLIKAFNNQTYSDLKFRVENKFIYVHKWFVAEKCKHFDTMFSSEWSESKSNEIEITGHSYEGYYTFLRCLYTDSIDTNNIQLLMDFLDISNEYFEEKLKSKCVQKIKSLIDLQNVCYLYSHSIKYSSHELQNYCFEFMAERMDQIIGTEGYKQLVGENANKLLEDYIHFQKRQGDKIDPIPNKVKQGKHGCTIS